MAPQKENRTLILHCNPLPGETSPPTENLDELRLSMTRVGGVDQLQVSCGICCKLVHSGDLGSSCLSLASHILANPPVCTVACAVSPGWVVSVAFFLIGAYLDWKVLLIGIRLSRR